MKTPDELNRRMAEFMGWEKAHPDKNINPDKKYWYTSVDFSGNEHIFTIPGHELFDPYHNIANTFSVVDKLENEGYTFMLSGGIDGLQYRAEFRRPGWVNVCVGYSDKRCEAICEAALQTLDENAQNSQKTGA